MSEIQIIEPETTSKDSILKELLKLKQEGKFDEFSNLIKAYTSKEQKVLSSSSTSNLTIVSELTKQKVEQRQPEQQPADKENQQNKIISSNTCQRQQRIDTPKMIQQLIRLTKLTGEAFSRVSFGQCLPGYILEEPIVIENLSATNYIVCEIKALCLDQVLSGLDEYVYSIRKKENYSYNEVQVVKIRPGTKAQLFVALKTPNIKKEQKIPGRVVIKVAGARNVFEREIDVEVKIPEIQCLKTLYCQQYEMPVIKLAMKLITKADCKIPFKNLSKFNMKTEFELIKSDENEFAKGIQFKISPEEGILPANQVAMVILNAKRIASNPEKKKQLQNYTVNLLLLTKIQNSTMIFCFPLIIEMY